MPHVPEMEESEDGYTYDEFLAQHRLQLESSNIPELFWDVLFVKLKHEVYDAGCSFSILKVVYSEDDDDDDDDDGEGDDDAPRHGWKVVVTKEEGIDASDKSQVYLIDHAWTYKVESAGDHLESTPSLAYRMADLMEVDKELPSDQLVKSILKQSWRYSQTYTVGAAGSDGVSSASVWYIMDEFGSKIQHSDEPSVRAVPFYYAPQRMSFTIFWPVTNLDYNAEVTRDFAEGSTDDVRAARLLPWIHTDLTRINCEHVEPSDGFFEAFRQGETEPVIPDTDPSLPRDRSIAVYTDCHLVRGTLNDIKFELVDTPEQADVLWYRTHFKDFRELGSGGHPQWVNQFPFECVVNMKILMAIVARRAANGSDPRWLPITYDLQTELRQFVSYFQQQENKEEDNHWICKAWNLGRGLDMYITNDINQIVRLRESGPKIVCKYIEDPVLFYRDDVGHVKFDYRYVVMLCQVKPLKLFAHKVFWLRFANEPYSLDSFDNYQKHFTVMNYQSEKPLKQVHHDEFIGQFERQYPAYSWSSVEEDTFKVLTELFEAAGSVDPPKGINNYSQSRALYAVDLMLKWNTNDKGEKVMQPMVLEVNFSADNTRATQYHPDFYNDVFSAMFCDEIQDRPIISVT